MADISRSYIPLENCLILVDREYPRGTITGIARLCIALEIHVWYCKIVDTLGEPRLVLSDRGITSSRRVKFIKNDRMHYSYVHFNKSR